MAEMNGGMIVARTWQTQQPPVAELECGKSRQAEQRVRKKYSFALSGPSPVSKAMVTMFAEKDLRRRSIRMRGLDARSEWSNNYAVDNVDQDTINQIKADAIESAMRRFSCRKCPNGRTCPMGAVVLDSDRAIIAGLFASGASIIDDPTKPKGSAHSVSVVFDVTIRVRVTCNGMACAGAAGSEGLRMHRRLPQVASRAAEIL